MQLYFDQLGLIPESQSYLPFDADVGTRTIGEFPQGIRARGPICSQDERLFLTATRVGYRRGSDVNSYSNPLALSDLSNRS